jgi:hypothetical protein
MINKLSHIDYDVPGRIGLDEQRSTVGRCHDEDDAILFMPVVSFSVS